MRSILGYVAAILVAFLTMGIVGNIFTGIIPLVLSIALGLWLGNKTYKLISGKEPEQIHIFGKGRREADDSQNIK